MRSLWKKLVCIATAVSLSLCMVSAVPAETSAVDESKNATIIGEGPPILPSGDDSLTAPYSPGEMMDMEIDDADALLPSPLASYPAYTSSQISKRSDGKWIVTATGTVLNKWVTVDGKYRYYAAGILQIGWKELPISNDTGAATDWFYFDANGNMYTGWLYVSSSNTYMYLKPATGILAASEWLKIDGYWYYFDANGYMQRSWAYISSNWYYLRESTCSDYAGGPSRPDGSMVVGEKYLTNKIASYEPRSYYFDKNGVWQTWLYPLPLTPVSGVSTDNYTPFLVTSRFNEIRIIDERKNVHNGLDMRARVPIRITSPAKGEVVFSDSTTTMGNLVVIKTDVIAPNGNPLYIRVMHLSYRAVSSGDIVSAGTYLGNTGNTGNVDPHFHIDISAFKVTTGTVRGMVDENGNRLSSVVNPGQNPAALFGDVAWTNKMPHGAYYLGYTE